MSTPKGVRYENTTSTQNGHDIDVTWLDNVLANETWTIPSMQNTSAMGYATPRDVFFGRADNITVTAPPMFSSDDNSPDASLHIYLAIRALLGIIIMTFNGLLLYCIHHFPYLHTPTNTLVANLCIADFLGGCQQFFEIATAYHIGHSSWANLCLARVLINMLSMGGNVWSIFGISLDSCLFICKPLRYHNWVTIDRILKIMTIVWVYTIATATITLLMFNRLSIGMPCRSVIVIDPIIYKSVYFPQQICLITGFVLCYVIIAVVAWKQKNRVAPQIAPTEAPNPNVTAPDSTPSAPNWKITKMMAMVPGVYLLSMFPATVFAILNNRLARESMVYMDRAASILWFTQSWANPLIYAWKNEDFRRAIKTVLRIYNRININAENNIL